MEVATKRYKNEQKKWTKEEDDYVIENLSSSSLGRISSKLKRSRHSILSRLARLGRHDMAVETGSFRTHELGALVGVDPKTVYTWVKDKGLPAVQFYKEGANDEKARFNYIFPEDFWDWAEQHKTLIAFKKIQRNQLLPEPDWFHEALKNDNKSARHKMPWTKEDDDLIWRLFYNESMLQKEIAVVVNRTQPSINKRIARLRKQKMGVKA